MTPEELETLVLESSKARQIERAFIGMPETDRAKLSTTAQQLHSQLNRGKANAKASDRLKALLSKRKGHSWDHWHKPDTQRAMLTVFACGPLSAVKKSTLHIDYQYRKNVEQIIADRRPEWLDGWIDHELQSEFTSLDFPTIHQWMKQGLAEKPTADKYYELFAWHMMRTGFYDREEGTPPPLSEQLLADPILMENVEGLFRVETSAFNTNEWLTRGASEAYETWPQALKKLSDQGHLKRDYLLDLALDGLKADIKQNQLSGYSKFFKSMEPEGKELTSRQQGFIDLLCHQVGHVQKFAVDMLAKVEQLKQLDDDLVIRELAGVFAGEAKGNAMAALRLLDKVIKRTGKIGAPDAAALDAVSEALRHVHADVQAKAVTLLTAQSDHLTEAQWQDIAALSDFVAASTRPALAELMAKSDLEIDVLPEPSETAAPETYSPISNDVLSSKVLFDEDRLEPIATLDELIDTALHCVEVVDSPEEIERLIDGISRFADQRPPDFDERVAPMLHRLKNGTAQMNSLGAASPGVAQAMVALVMTWATGTFYQSDRSESTYFVREGAFVPVIEHLEAISRRIVGGEARAVLSFPTHRGGWIDPLVWIDRVSEQAKRPRLAESIDLHRSMLRLAPDNRAEALARAKGMSGNIGRIVGFALGGDSQPVAKDHAHYAAWVCAARARDPKCDWRTEFAPFGVHDPWPGGAAPAHYEWSTSHKQHQHEQMRWKTPIFNIAVKLPDKEPEQQDAKPGLLKRLGKIARLAAPIGWEVLPSAALNRPSKTKPYWSSELNAVWVSQWHSQLWPLEPSGSYFSSVKSLVSRTDDDASNWSPTFGFFEALFVKGRPWGEGGHLMLCLGLVGKDADAKGLAIDALIDGVDRRVFDPEQFGTVMSKLAAGEWIKLNRLGASLTQCLQASPLHAVAISDAMQRWLPNFDLNQRNSHHILEAFVEAQAVARLPLSEAMVARLEQVSGKGKAAKLAKQLLQSQSSAKAA